MKNKTKNSSGFTIMELLVAISIGLFLIGAMSKLFFDSKSSIRSQNNSSKMVEDSSFSLFSMQNDIAGAAFRGCNGGVIAKVTKENFSNTTGVNNYLTKSIFMEGSVGNGTGFTPTIDTFVSSLNPAPSPKFDTLTIRSANSDSSLLTADQSATNSALTVASVNVAANDIALISNCATNNLFKVGSISANKITPSVALATTFPAGSQVYKYSTIIYYVGTDNTLYKAVNNNTPMALAYNVEKFSILYGVNTDNTTGNVNSYVFANSVTDFSKVLAIRIGIVLKGSDNNTIGTSKSAYNYKFNGVTVTPNDGKLRKVFYTTITLRNMVP